MLKVIAGLMLAAVSGASLAAAPIAPAHSVYVMRHLQKAAGDDPELTAEGAAAARELAALLADKGIKAVFATATRRAQETGAPLAALMKVPVTTYDPRDVAALTKAVVAANGPALIVGHSNTVPGIVAAFGAAKPADIAEDQYGTLFVVEPGKASAQQLRLAR